MIGNFNLLEDRCIKSFPYSRRSFLTLDQLRRVPHIVSNIFGRVPRDSVVHKFFVSIRCKALLATSVIDPQLGLK